MSKDFVCTLSIYIYISFFFFKYTTGQKFGATLEILKKKLNQAFYFMKSRKKPIHKYKKHAKSNATDLISCSIHLTNI